MSTSIAAKQLRIHVCLAQRCVLQYEKDPESIFKKRKANGCPHIIYEEHKKVILKCVDENPSIILEQLMNQLFQRFQRHKVSKARFHPFTKNEYNLSFFLKKKSSVSACRQDGKGYGAYF